MGVYYGIKPGNCFKRYLPVQCTSQEQVQYYLFQNLQNKSSKLERIALNRLTYKMFVTIIFTVNSFAVVL